MPSARMRFPDWVELQFQTSQRVGGHAQGRWRPSTVGLSRFQTSQRVGGHAQAELVKSATGTKGFKPLSESVGMPSSAWNTDINESSSFKPLSESVGMPSEKNFKGFWGEKFQTSQRVGGHAQVAFAATVRVLKVSNLSASRWACPDQSAVV